MSRILPQTRQTWRGKPVRELFAEIAEANPDATEDILRTRFYDAAVADSEYLRAIVDYAFDAAWRAYGKQQAIVPASLAMPRPRAAILRAATEQVQAHSQDVEYIKEQIILLNQEMPNGMRARNCTLDYMFRLGGKYRSIGKQGSQKLVGAVYDETAYRAKLKGVV